MKLAALSLKQAVIAGLLIVGSVASLVLIAPNLFGRERAADTDVAGTTTTRPAAAPAVPLEAVEPSPAPTALDSAQPDRTAAASADSGTSTSTGTGNGSAPQPSAGVVNGGGQGQAGGSKRPSGGNKPGTDSAKAFEIKGDVTGVLYPTVTSDLPVKVENPFNFPIRITSAAVTVGNGGACAPRHLHINGEQPSSNGAVDLPIGQLVPAGGEITYTVPAELQNSAGDECQNANFSLSYAAKAAKA